jgi:Rieske Fe-S protein
MTAEPHPGLHSRRCALTVGAVAAGAVTISACGGGGADTPSPGETPTPTAGARLVALADIPVGEATSVTTGDDQEIIVSRPTETTAAAFSAVCTHQQCTVQPDGGQLRCPCHGSVFDALTGEVRNGPADKPLPPVAVTVADGNVLAE